jgi:hypothetical protein
MWSGWINYICGVVFFLMVPGILFTVPLQNKYAVAAVHAVLFVIVHHTLNAVLKKQFGLSEPTLSSL